VSAFEPPASVPAPPPGAFGTCECGHPIYDHSRLNQDGNQVWNGCRVDGCTCSKWQASDGSAWPNVYAKAVPGDPTDLDVNSEAWVDGQVLLAHERAARKGRAA
jgi:hypothetical protein